MTDALALSTERTCCHGDLRGSTWNRNHTSRISAVIGLCARFVLPPSPLGAGTLLEVSPLTLGSFGFKLPQSSGERGQASELNAHKTPHVVSFGEFRRQIRGRGAVLLAFGPCAGAKKLARSKGARGRGEPIVTPLAEETVDTRPPRTGTGCIKLYVELTRSCARVEGGGAGPGTPGGR